jgi:ABC-type sugar transport system substrate-binding protein
MEDSVNPGIEAAFATGIPVVIFDRHCSTDKYTNFVSYPDKDCAIVSAEYMVQYLTKANSLACSDFTLVSMQGK